MANEVIKATLQIVVDSAQAKTALQGFKREMQSTTTALNQGGQQASRSFGSIGRAANSASVQAEAAGRKVLQLLERQSDRISLTVAEYAKLQSQQRTEANAQMVPFSVRIDTMVPGAQVASAATASIERASGSSSAGMLLERGSQLNDTMEAMGTIGMAVRGASPFTLAAAAVGSVAAAAATGANEMDRYNQALATTQGYAGLTAQNLSDMASRIGESSGSTGLAADALAQLVATGQISGSAIERIGQAAVEMSNVTGQSVEDTVRQYERLSESPSQALVQLNQQQRFLTEEAYEQVRALEAQGRIREATDLAFQIYSNAQLEQTARIKESLGTLGSAWLTLKDLAGQAWNAMLNVGRPESTEKLKAQRAALHETLEKFQASEGALDAGAASGGTAAGQQSMWRGGGAAGFSSQISAYQSQIAGLDAEIAGRERAASEAIAKAEEMTRAQQRLAEKVGQAATAPISQRVVIRSVPVSPKSTDSKPAVVNELEEWRKRMGEFRQEIPAAQAAQSLQYSQKLNAFGMSEQAQQRATAESALRREYAQRLESLDKMTPEKFRGLSEYSNAKQEIGTGLQTALADQEAYYARLEELQSSWSLGAQSAMSKFVEDSRNGYTLVGQAATKWLEDFDARLAQAVLTGKLNFSDLANSIINDLIRIQIRQSITGPLVGALSDLMSGLFGASGSTVVGNGIGSGAGSMSAAQWMPSFGGGKADGGQTTPGTMYEVNEIGPELYHEGGRSWLMTGGRDGYVTPVSSDGMAGAMAPSVEINITNNGSGRAEASTDNVSFDGEKYVVGIVLNDLRRNGPIAQNLGNRGR